jgi:hypothetical protein
MAGTAAARRPSKEHATGQTANTGDGDPGRLRRHRGGGLRNHARDDVAPARHAAPGDAANGHAAGGCNTVLFSIDGRQQPALANSATLVPQVLKAAGLHWRVS